MTLENIGGLASLTCAATYLFGFIFLVTLFAPTGYGSVNLDAAAVVALIYTHPGLMTFWNSLIYILNALALALLVVALHARLAPAAPSWADVTRGLGLIWAALVLGAGMIANIAVEHAAFLYASSPQQAAQEWALLHKVELGLGGGNEIAGCAWILLVSLAASKARRLGKFAISLGVLCGISGFATLFPTIGEAAGAVFGLAAIAWFIAVGLTLLLAPRIHT